MTINYVLYNQDAENHTFIKLQSRYGSETECENIQGLEKAMPKIERDYNQPPKCDLNTLKLRKLEKTHEIKVEQGDVTECRQWFVKLIQLAVKCYDLLEMVHLVSPVWIFHPYMSHRTLRGRRQFNKPQDNLVA